MHLAMFYTVSDAGVWHPAVYTVSDAGVSAEQLHLAVFYTVHDAGVSVE